MRSGEGDRYRQASIQSTQVVHAVLDERDVVLSVHARVESRVGDVGDALLLEELGFLYVMIECER